MENEQLLLLFVKLISGFFAAFTAVLLWSKTRQIAWLFIVVGTVFLYGEIIFSSLDYFGILNLYLFAIYGISVIKLFFAVMPYLFFTTGFMIFLLSKRGRF